MHVDDRWRLPMCEKMCRKRNEKNVMMAMILLRRSNTDHMFPEQKEVGSHVYECCTMSINICFVLTRLMTKYFWRSLLYFSDIRLLHQHWKVSWAVSIPCRSRKLPLMPETSLVSNAQSDMINLNLTMRTVARTHWNVSPMISIN